MTYKEFAMNAKQKNPKITQPELEMKYSAYLKLQRDAKSKQDSALSKEKPKQPAASAESSEAQRKHAFRLALMKHALRPVPGQAMIAAAQEKFPVITYTQSGRFFTTIQPGGRLWLSPSINGENIAIGFVLPTGNATWTLGLNDPSSTHRRALQNVMSLDATAMTNGNNFGNTGHPYFTESGAKELITVDARGTDLATALNASPITTNADQVTFARCNMASYAFDMQVASTYLATALVNVQCTDDSGAATKDARANHVADEDGIVGSVLRSRLSATVGSVETTAQITQAADLDIVGPGQTRHFCGNVRLCKPFWNFAGWMDRSTVSTRDIENGLAVDFNPWYGAYATGSFFCVEAVGGAVSVSFKAQRTTHVEYMMPQDAATDTATYTTLQLLGPNVHYTSTDPVVASVGHAPLAVSGTGSTVQEALKNLDKETGLPVGSSREVSNITNSVPHPAPSVTAANDLWGEVKGVGSVVADVAKTAAKGISWISKAKNAWTAASDIGEFAEGLGMLL
jgi:hypothetical protein